MPPLVSIGTHKGKAVDLTYRQLEKSSEVRAEMVGDPSLKVTNLKDNLRERRLARMLRDRKTIKSMVRSLD